MNVDKLQGGSKVNTIDEWLLGDVRQNVALPRSSKEDPSSMTAILTSRPKAWFEWRWRFHQNGIAFNPYMNIRPTHVDLVIQADDVSEVGDPNMWVNNPTWEDCNPYLPEDVATSRGCAIRTNDILANVLESHEGYTYSSSMKKPFLTIHGNFGRCRVLWEPISPRRFLRLYS